MRVCCRRKTTALALIYVNEVKLLNEREISYENKVREILNNYIIPHLPEIQVLESKVVADIIICRNGDVPKLFFLEIKHYSYSNNRIGFGSKGKVTFQPEILSKRPEYFDGNMRWVFFRQGDSGYYVLTNDDCCKYVMGQGIDINKQNNFKDRLYQEIAPLTEDDFKTWLLAWLKS